MALWNFQSETNDKKNSKKEIHINVITFNQLRDKYPTPAPKHLDENNNDIFTDHCAIRLSDTFLSLDIKMKSFRGKRCYGKCNHIRQHALVAQELADWLKKKPFPGCPTANKYTGENFEENITGKTGIVYFKDYWARNPKNSSIRTGDHIDLWDGSILLSNGRWTYFRLNFPSVSEFMGTSDLTKSSEVLFWEIK